MITNIKTWLSVGGIAGAVLLGIYLNRLQNKAEQRDEYARQNKTLAAETKALRDTVRLQTELLAKALIDTKNATELHTITKGMTTSFQTVIAVMRDSVISTNRDRLKLQLQVIELQKEVERLKRRR